MIVHSKDIEVRALSDDRIELGKCGCASPVVVNRRESADRVEIPVGFIEACRCVQRALIFKISPYFDVCSFLAERAILDSAAGKEGFVETGF